MILSHTLAFIDTETTGTDSSVHEIIELGLVLAKWNGAELAVVDQLNVKILPRHIETAEPVALRVNGYSPDDWLFGITLNQAMQIFAEKTAGAVFVAHNVIFDFAFIEKAFKDCAMENLMHFIIKAI